MSYLLVFLGGFLGALCRTMISSIFNGDLFIIGTLVFNILGCFIIGVLYKVLVGEKYKNLSCFFITGFCGAFTSFSTFMLDSMKLSLIGNLFIFMLYIFISVFIGIGSSIIGSKVGDKLCQL